MRSSAKSKKSSFGSKQALDPVEDGEVSGVNGGVDIMLFLTPFD